MRKAFFYWIKDVAAIVLLVFGSLVYFQPLWAAPTTRVINDYDGVFIAYVLKTVSITIQEGSFATFFDGPIFYPNRNTLAYSDLFVTSAVLALPLSFIHAEPFALLTFNTLLSHSLLLIFLYFLLHELTADRGVAVGFAGIFGFSALLLQYAGHLQMLSIFWIPLALLSLVKVKNNQSLPWSIVFFLSLLAQLWNSLLPGVFIGFITLIIFIFSPSLRKAVAYRLRFYLLLLLLTIAGVAPLLLTYFSVSRQFHYVRPITDVIHFSLSPEELWTHFASPALYISFAVALFSVITHPLFRSFAKKYWVGGAAAFILALGPALHWGGKTVKLFSLHIPLPYLLFYLAIPGFSVFRTPSRWIVLWGLLWTVAAAIVLVKLPQRIGKSILCLLVLLSIWTIPPLTVANVPSVADYPLEYYWLSEQPAGAVIELPIFRWGSDTFSKNETRRMIYQTYHRHPLVNGYSGFSPPAFDALVAKLAHQFPDEATLAELKTQGVKYIIVHPKEYEQWLQQPGESLSLPELFRTDSAVVYAL